MVVHDLAYAALVFDGYTAPSFLQVKGAKDVGVEFFSLSKSYSMPGWRVGFAVGNQKMINALGRIKSYFDYGVFQPIQIASIIALNEGDADVVDIVESTGNGVMSFVKAFTVSDGRLKSQKLLCSSGQKYRKPSNRWVQ